MDYKKHSLLEAKYKGEIKLQLKNNEINTVHE